MLTFYRVVACFLYPLFCLIIFIRIFLKKEDKIRFKEKLFTKYFNIKKNPTKKLIWFHVASIGELQSIIPIIKKLNDEQKQLEILITTITLTSANLFDKQIKRYKNIHHRFFPLDIVFLSNFFLKKWQPDLVCFVDSEIWPNFLFNIKEKKIPLIFLNGRITNKTFYRWKKIISFAKKVFNNFDLSLTSSKNSKNNLKKLNAKNLKYYGNLKFSLQIENNLKKKPKFNTILLKKFNIWCAVSTHNNEEEFIIKTHNKIKNKINKLKTIIIPRHIDRSFEIKNISEKFGLNTQILNEKDKINKNSEIIIINTYGILNYYFSNSKIVFMGKSLIEKLRFVGGQNPIEPAKYGCKIFHGPYTYNFKEIYELLSKYKITEQVNNETDLANKIIRCFKSKIRIKKINLLNLYGENILNKTNKEIIRHIN